MPPVSAKRPFPTVWMLFLLVGLCVCMQYVTLEKFAVFHPGKSHVTLVNFVGYVAERITFDALDAVLLALFLISTAFLLYNEWRRRVLSDFLQCCFASPARTLWLLAGSLLVCTRFYFALGELSWAADASHHIVMSWLAVEAIAAGQVPVWTFFMGTGSPYLQNYGFAFFYLVGVVDLLCRDLFLSLKLTMAAAHLLSGIGMYFLAAGLCRSRRAGFVAGLGYALCFWHTQQVLIMGRLPLSLFYAILPWAFHYVERVVASPSKMRAALLGGVSLALLNFTHPGYGTYAMVLLGCYSLVRLWSCRKRADAGAILRAGLLLFLLGAAFGSYMNAGMYFERAHTRIHEFSVNMSGVPDPTWRHLLGWSNFRFWLIPPEPYHWYGGYMGISLVLLALTGGALGLRRRDRRLAPCWVCLVLVALVVVAYRWPPLAGLPLVHAFNASRYLLFLSFFLALAAGMGVYLLLRHGPRALPRSRWYTLLLLVLLIDLFPTTFVQPYCAEDYSPCGLPRDIFEPVAAAAAPFAQRDELPNYRAHWVAAGLNIYRRQACMLHEGATPIAEAFHPGELRTLGTFTRPFTDWAHALLAQMESPEQLTAHPQFELLRDGLYLLNTRYLIASSNQNRFATVLALSYSPIVVSGRLKGYDEKTADLGAVSARIGAGPEEDEGMARTLGIIARTGLQRPLGSLSCERILVRDMEGERDLGTAPTAKVVSHVVGRQEVEMKVAVSAKCYARLAYAYFPYLQVRVDGKAVRPLQTAGRFMALPLDAGEHDIVIKARLSPLRRGLLALAAVSLVMALVLVFREHRNKRAEPARPIPAPGAREG